MTTNKVSNDDLINSFLKTSSTKSVGTTSKTSSTKSTGSCCSGKTYDTTDETVKLNISSKSSGCSKTSTSTVGQQKYGGTVVAMLESPVTTASDSTNFISTYLGANTSKLKNAQYDSSGRVTYYEDSGWSCKHKQQNSYTLEYLKSGATKVTTQNGCNKEISIYDYISQSSCGCSSKTTKKSSCCTTKKTDTSGCDCSTTKTDTTSCCSTKKNSGCSTNSGNTTNKTVNVDETVTNIQDSYNTCNSNNSSTKNVNVNQNITTIQDSYNTVNSNNTTTNNYTKNVNVTSNVNSNNKITVNKNVNVINNVNNGIIDGNGNDTYDNEGNDIYANNNQGIIDTDGNDVYAKNVTTNNISKTNNVTKNIVINNYNEVEDPEDPEDPDPDPEEPETIDLMPLRNLLSTIDGIKRTDGVISDKEMERAMANPSLANLDSDTTSFSSEELAILNEVKTFYSDTTLITNLFNGDYDSIDETTLNKLQTLSDKIKVLKG